MEQRISRCHRIGQQTDVFVINFICPENFSDVRMYELFYKRLNISNNIIGASDTIISGAIDGEIEENIKDTLESVRKKKEVQIEFADLSEEFKEELEEIKAQSNDILFNTFDRRIVESTRNMAEIIKRKVSELEDTIKELAGFYYKDSFIDENTFEAKTSWHNKNPFAYPFKFSLVNDEKYRPFTLGSEPCQSMLTNLTNSFLIKPSKLILKSDNTKLKGLKGYISSYGVNISYAFNWTKANRCIGLCDNGSYLNNEQCDEILDLECVEFVENIDIPTDVKENLDKKFEDLIPSIVEPLKAEMDKSSSQ